MNILKKAYLSLLSGITVIWLTSQVFGAWVPIQPIYHGYSKTISYIDLTYYQTKIITGIAGYKSLDKMVELEKITFVSDAYLGEEGNKIFMVRIIDTKQIVGYGIKVWESRFSLEDSDCDGVMDKVGIYNKPVFPPNCFYAEAI